LKVAFRERWRARGAGDGARRRFSGGENTEFLQPVANDVGLIPEIDPRREGAAESRHQFHAPALNVDIGSAASLVRRRSVLAEVIREIDCRFLDFQQRLGRGPFRVNRVVASELDVEKF
jgi:hypothetical protein